MKKQKFSLQACELMMAGVLSLSPAVASADTLRAIVTGEDITAANPDGASPISLFVGNGAGASPQINNHGDVLFPALTWSGVPIEQPKARLYSYNPENGIRYLLGDGDGLTNANGENISALLQSAINQGYRPTIAGNGDGLLMCRLSGPSITAANDLGLTRAGAESRLLVQNQSALESLSVHAVVAALEPREHPGEQYIAVNLNADGSESAMLHRSSSGISEIARTGMPAAGIESASYAMFPNALKTIRTVNDAGDLAFTATLTGGKLNITNDEAVYRYRHGSLELVAREGMLASGDPAGCELYSPSYARLQVNGSGKVVFNAGAICSGITVYSDRSGALKREAYATKMFDGATGRFRLGLLNEITTALGTNGDAVNYLKGFLADNGDLYVLGTILNEDGSIRSDWGIVRIALDGSAVLALESSAQHSPLGIGLAGSPFPEQVSIARDGTILARVQMLGSSERLLIVSAPGRELLAIRTGDEIDGYTVDVRGGNHVSGIALPNGKFFADVRALAPGDDPNSAGRSALVGLSATGQVSLPVVGGLTNVNYPGGEVLPLQHFATPFGSVIKRHVASDSGQMPLLGLVQREGMDAEWAVLVLDTALPALSPADFDQNGIVEVADIFAFLSAYFAQDPRADMDRNGTIAVPDVFVFLSHYFAH